MITLLQHKFFSFLLIGITYLTHVNQISSLNNSQAETTIHFGNLTRRIEFQLHKTLGNIIVPTVTEELQIIDGFKSSCTGNVVQHGDTKELIFEILPDEDIENALLEGALLNFGKEKPEYQVLGADLHARFIPNSRNGICKVAFEGNLHRQKPVTVKISWKSTTDKLEATDEFALHTRKGNLLAPIIAPLESF